MTALIALIKVQIRLYLNNRRAMLINIVMPILIGAFFGFVMGGSGVEKPLHVKVAIVDQDQSELSKKIVDALAGDANLDVQRIDEGEAKELVKGGKLKAALVLPKGFGDTASRAMFGGDKIELPLYYDPSEKMALSMLRGLLAQYTMQQAMTSSFSGANGQKVLDDAVAQLDQAKNLEPAQRDTLSALFKNIQKVQQFPAAASAASGADSGGGFKGLAPPYTLNEQGLSAGQRGYNGFAHSFAGMGAQFVLFMGINLGADILLARRSGMWLRLRAAPLSRATLLGSYFCSTALIASVVLALVMAAGMLLFDFGIAGSALGLAMVIVSYGLFTAGFGLFIAAIGGSPEATRGLATMAVLLMVMLGGAWVPSFIFPEWMQQVTLVVPVRWAVDGLDGMTWRGLGLDVGALAAAVLTGFALLFAALAWWRFDWRE
ncbi:MAG TPA: ABC transporter permease, partial [Burkholderiaceae bacterium]